MPRTTAPRRQSAVLAEVAPTRRRRRRRTGGVVIGVLLLGVAGAGYAGLHHAGLAPTSPRCLATVGQSTVDFDPEQTGNAATIVAIASKRGLPARAATIAVATAIQESKLRNLDYGDRDSLGLFQQRPSQGWGTAAQLKDPEFATNAFYNALVKIDGYQTMEITKVAQAVQRSATPEAYAEHEQEGRVLADTLSGYTAGGLGCRLADPTSAGQGSRLAATLVRDLGVRGTSSGSTVTVSARDARHAWAVGAWAVAKAADFGVTSVVVGDQQWQRSLKPSATDWAATEDAGSSSIVTITFG